MIVIVRNSIYTHTTKCIIDCTPTTMQNQKNVWLVNVCQHPQLCCTGGARGPPPRRQFRWGSKILNAGVWWNSSRRPQEFNVTATAATDGAARSPVRLTYSKLVQTLLSVQMGLYSQGADEFKIFVPIFILPLPVTLNCADMQWTSQINQPKT